MGTGRFAVLGFLLAASVGLQSAWAAEILMPAGSKVWMKWDASVAPDADFDDAAGSNLLGIAPPNGIPTKTITENAPGNNSLRPEKSLKILASIPWSWRPGCAAACG